MTETDMEADLASLEIAAAKLESCSTPPSGELYLHSKNDSGSSL